MIVLDLSILNQKGTPMFNSDTFANRPTFGIVGRIFISTDTKEFFRDTGTSWELIGGPGSGTITGTGAAGQVTYFTGASSVAGSNNLFWDAANARLGIGTTTPTGTRLDIRENSANAIRWGSISTQYGFLSWDTNQSIIGSLGASSSIGFWTNGVNERMRITSAGNLLVGTTTDAGYKLDIVSSTTTIARFTGATNAYIDITDGTVNSRIQNSGGLLIGTTTSHDLILRTNSVSRLTITAAGNVGLGLVPSAFSGLSGKVFEFGTAFGDSGSIFQNDVDDLRLMSNVYFNGSFRYVRTGTATIFQSINGSYIWNIAASGTANNVISFTQPMTLSSAGNLLLGTTTDTGYRCQITSASGDSMLNVWGATAPSIRLDNAASGASRRFVIGLATATNNFIQGAVANDACIATASSNPLLFGMWVSTSATEVMRISTALNLQIGSITDTGEKFQLTGSIRVNGQLSGSSGGNSGQHLIINCDGTTYKIRLENV